MRGKYTQGESGQASVLEAVIVILAVFMLALPLFEYGRMANDSILAASAAEDAAKAIATNPDMTTRDVDEFVKTGYASIANEATVETSVSPQKQESYTHYLNVEGGGYTARPSKVAWREIEVRILVRRDFLLPIGDFIGIPGASGYEISKAATATTDQTIKNGAW